MTDPLAAEPAMLILANYTDHSTPEGCGCGERATSAQTGPDPGVPNPAEWDAGPVTKPQEESR